MHATTFDYKRLAHEKYRTATHLSLLSQQKKRGKKKKNGNKNIKSLHLSKGNKCHKPNTERERVRERASRTAEKVKKY